MMVFTVQVNGTERIDYQRYIDADILPDRVLVERELESAFGEVSRQLARTLHEEDVMMAPVLLQADVSFSVRADLDESLEAALQAEKPDLFPTLVTQYALRQGLPSFSTLYNRAGISRQLFSRMCAFGSSSIPKRENILRIAFALRATPEEAERLLNAKGYAFRDHDRTDIILRYCLSRRIHDPRQVDALLDDHGCPTLFSDPG